jgi:hypothetical protein
VTVIERELGTVVLERHRVIQVRFLYDFDLLHPEFISARETWCALILTDRTRDDDG